VDAKKEATDYYVNFGFVPLETVDNERGDVRVWVKYDLRAP
jgi:hypothetical protein